MRSFGVIALVCFAVLLGTNAQSSNCFVCPATDKSGFSLGQADLTQNPFFCSYPSTPGENPNDFFCTYSPSSGNLVTDNDASFCPPDAANTCPQSSVISGPGRRSPKHGNVKTRSKLGVAKRAERAEKKRNEAEDVSV